jgi:hypothetical protein
MKFLIRILNWIFIAYAILFPLTIIGISVKSGVGQGIQFIVMPFVLCYFLILFWWTKNLIRYITVSTQAIVQKEKYFILLQTLCLYVFVIAPLTIFTTYVIWNRFTRPNPLENVAAQCFMFLISSGVVFIILGIILGIRYNSKTKGCVTAT